ncbi:hypothetical protein CDAR_576581 [Caerostris darwini]|uniref:Uncharacterized protein n=1 Tax=Caerostris darwini TaxID=1538125 RepID=A0AAV4TJM6_9ARAC|nr:hypothetical protein CDAR_576581 [Caerostris darwini]
MYEQDKYASMTVYNFIQELADFPTTQSDTGGRASTLREWTQLLWSLTVTFTPTAGTYYVLSHTEIVTASKSQRRFSLAYDFVRRSLPSGCAEPNDTPSYIRVLHHRLPTCVVPPPSFRTCMPTFH